MHVTPVDQAEALLIQMRATSARQPGSPQRLETMAIEHRQAEQMIEQLLAYCDGQTHYFDRLLRLVKHLLVTLYSGTNGHRFWRPSLPQAVKSAAISLNQFLRNR